MLIHTHPMKAPDLVVDSAASNIIDGRDQKARHCNMFVLRLT